MEAQRLISNLGDAVLQSSAHAHSQAEKVAILLASLDSQVAVDLLKKFDPEDVKRILASSGKLGSLNAGDVAPLITEFTSEFAEALGISAGSREMVALLESAFSGKELDSIMGKEPVEEQSSIWPRFKPGMEETLVPYLLDESEQTAAVIVARLPVELGAKCIAMLPRGLSRKIVSRMIALGTPSPAALKLLEDTLEEDFFGQAGNKDKNVKIDKMAAIVNKLERQQSLDLMEDLAKSNPEEAKLLRKLIFMFEDIEQVDAKHRAKLFDRVPVEWVIPALFSATAPLTESVLSALSARSRRMVESELQGDITKPHKDTPSARRKIADLAIQMAKSRDIELPDAAAPQPAEKRI